MRRALIVLLVIYVSSISCFGQVSFTGSTGSISTDDDASAVVVDNVLEITTTHSIDGARVSITSNYVSGDLLSYTSALPSGVTSSYNASLGVLTFTGSASASDYQALLRSVTFTATANGASNRVIEFYLGSTYLNTTNNHFYQYIPSTDISWTSAKAGAASKNYFGLTGYLATITSANENQLIQGLIPTNDANAAAWIGASDEYNEINAATGATTYANQGLSEGNFFWVTGPVGEIGTRFSTGNSGTNSPVVESGQYMNWNSGEPNDWGSGEHYVEMKLSGGWNDDAVSGGNNVDGYIVEYVGLSGEPTLDVTHSRTVVVKPTILTTTSSSNYHVQNSSVIVDPALEIKSGGMITDARVTISGNFTPGDGLWHQIARPTGITGGYYDNDQGVFYFYGTAKPSDWQALLRSMTFQSSSTSSLDRTITFSVGNLISGANGHFYEYVPTTTFNTSSWTAAHDAAAARTYMGLQGYLATITNETENELISNKLSADGWLGGSDDVSVVSTAATAAGLSYTAAEGNFYWVTGPEKGTPISFGNSPSTILQTYANWYNGEPNDYNGENYLKMYSVSGALGTWNDMPLNSTVGMVVEYGGLSTDPTGLVLSASRILTNDQPLPVQGLSLQLREKGSNVVLNWTVLGAQDVRQYNVLHSSNGSSFRKIGEVKAVDKYNKPVYSYTDQNAVNGTNYYKIVVVDEDGKQHYSDVRSIAITGKLQLYPTLINNHFTVNQPNSAPCQLILTDALGVRLLQRTIKQGLNTIEVGYLTEGTYFVQISNGTKEPPDVFKIIKR
jgi:hypothetical protein